MGQANIYIKQSLTIPQTTSFVSTKLVNLSLTGLATGQEAEDINTAVDTATNAVENNYLKHREIQELHEKKLQCSNNDIAACARVKELQELSKDRDNKLDACENIYSNECSTLRKEVRSAAAEIVRKSVGGSISDTFTKTYTIESKNTKKEASDTMRRGDIFWAGVDSTIKTIVDGLFGTGELIGNTAGMFESSFIREHETDRQRIGEIVQYMIQNRDLIIEGLGKSYKDYMYEIADAYEQGDAIKLGELRGIFFGNIFPAAGVVGVVKKVDKLIPDDLNNLSNVPKRGKGVEGFNPKYWNTPIESAGRRVYQRNDLFDLTPDNLARMQKGRPPIGRDGEPVNLHHLTQDEPGAIAEVGGKFHSDNTKTLHELTEPIGSFRYSPDGKTTEAELAFRRWSYRYWQDRAKDLY